ncbi:MAG: cobalamin-dependent protein, partial [Candidatus Bathyarchaeia archaeon]
GIKMRVKRVLDAGVEPKEIIEIVSLGLEEVGKKYESGEYFLSELIMAGIIGSEILGVLKPYLTSERMGYLGKVVIGTVKGDLHDVGKNIVVSMLASSGFEVIDLGIDVPSTKFLETVKKESPDVLAMSCLLTMAMDEMKRVIDDLKKSGLRDKVKVIIGGRPTSLDFALEIGADAYGSDAVEAVKAVKKLLGK